MKTKTKQSFDDSIILTSRRARSGRGKIPGRSTAVTKYVIQKYVDRRGDENFSILDFGSGSQAYQARILKAACFRNVRALDLPFNMEMWARRINAWSYDYDLVMASNVLNVQPNLRELRRTMRLISALTYGEAVINYPSSPRFMPRLEVAHMKWYLDGVFNWVQRVPKAESGNNIIWVCTNLHSSQRKGGRPRRRAKHV